MRIPKSSGFVPVALAFGSPLAAQIGKPIRTQAGMVQGVEANGIAVYKGIPSLQSPVISVTSMSQSWWNSPRRTA